MADVTIDLDSFTIDEVGIVEDTCDADFDDVMAGKVRKKKMLQAFALVALRRQDPNATLEDAGKVEVRGLEAMLGDRPTVAAGPPATPASPASPKRRASRSSGSRG